MNLDNDKLIDCSIETLEKLKLNNFAKDLEYLYKYRGGEKIVNTLNNDLKKLYLFNKENNEINQLLKYILFNKSYDIYELPKNSNLQVISTIVDTIVKITSGHFPNSIAMLITTLAMTHIVGQFRPTIKINEIIINYDDKGLGVSLFGFGFISSGKGKDISLNTTFDIFKKVIKNLEVIMKNTLEKQKIKDYITKQKIENNDPDFSEEDIDQKDFIEFIRSKGDKYAFKNILENLKLDINSTQEGLTKLASDISNRPYGTVSIFSSELGAMLKANIDNVRNVVSLLSNNFDSGYIAQKQLKDNSNQVEAVTDLYLNLLGFTSPNIIMTDNVIKSNLATYFETMLARRSLVAYPSLEELSSNLKSINVEEDTYDNLVKEQIYNTKQINTEIINQLSNQVYDNFRKFINIDNEGLEYIQDIEITAEEETIKLYHYYQLFNKTVGTLISNIKNFKNSKTYIDVQIMNRAIIAIRLASVWVLVEGRTIITKEDLLQAIYYVEYSGKHSYKLDRDLILSETERLINDINQGLYNKVNSINLSDLYDLGYLKKTQINENTIVNSINYVNSFVKDRVLLLFNNKHRTISFNWITNISNANQISLSFNNNSIIQFKLNEISNIINKLRKVPYTLSPLHNPDNNLLFIDINNMNDNTELLNIFKSLQYMYIFISFKEKQRGLLILILDSIVNDKKQYLFLKSTIAKQYHLKSSTTYDLKITNLKSISYSINNCKPYPVKPLLTKNFLLNTDEISKLQKEELIKDIDKELSDVNKIKLSNNSNKLPQYKYDDNGIIIPVVDKRLKLDNVHEKILEIYSKDTYIDNTHNELVNIISYYYSKGIPLQSIANSLVKLLTDDYMFGQIENNVYRIVNSYIDLIIQHSIRGLYPNKLSNTLGSTIKHLEQNFVKLYKLKNINDDLIFIDKFYADINYEDSYSLEIDNISKNDLELILSNFNKHFNSFNPFKTDTMYYNYE